MKVRKLEWWLLFASLHLTFTLTYGQKSWGFLNPQSACKINCLNNGVCAYDTSAPDQHKCICMLDMFEGQYCELKVTSTTTTEPSTVSDGQIYEDEDEDKLHAASPDLHYTEFNSRADDELQKINLPVDEQSKSSTVNTNQADDYAEFEPRNDELYHEAVISTSESAGNIVSSESQTVSSVQAETAQSNSYYERDTRPEWDKENQAQVKEDEEEFYEDDSSWMMFKRRAFNAATRRCSLASIAFTTAITVGILFVQTIFP